jgi:two-component system cell cycle sensor histidine kinase/response regulator CckA
MGPQTQQTVLVVEDDEGIAELERLRLEEAGYAVRLAGSAAAALAELAAGPIDLVLLDYRLPDAPDGLEFHARMRAAGYDLPVVLVTGFSDEATVIRALRAGARDFVTKSAEYLDYLPEAVARVLAQVRTEEALRRSEQRHRSFVETTKEWVWVCDPEGRMVYNNPALAEILGYAPDALAGENTLDLLHPDDRPAATAALARARTDRTGWSEVVFRWRHRDGTYRFLESNATPMFDPAGRLVGFQGSDRDITDRLRLETELRQSQKMEAVGRLAGGIAHDFNNLLTVINGFSEMLLMDPAVPPAAHQLVEEVARAGDHAAQLTRQLLAFSRKQVLAPRVLDPNALVREIERMLGRLIGADVSLASSLDPGLGRVRADPGQLEQVVLNLAVNARDAMPKGGHLTIETRNVEIDDEYARLVPNLRPGPYVLLAVTDTGVGMDPETKAHIFEPFFTTKEAGKGTGLGLATVYGIVDQSGGHIDVYSEPGRGTTFKIYLPRVTETDTPSTVGEGWQKVPRGTETILLADDDQGVRALSRLALVSYGYTVLEAADGVEAARVGTAYPGPIHLLATDLVMPRAGGREAAERLRPVHPETRVLFLSGYTDDSLVRHGVLEDGVAFLQKPFTPTTLARKVREVLDASSPSRWG